MPRLKTLDQLDGRTAAAKRAALLIGALEADAGGADQLSTGQREIIKRAALASTLCEHLECTWLDGGSVDVSDYAVLSNLERRLLVTVGLTREPRDVTPDRPLTESDLRIDRLLREARPR
jgi:hypothetical protein